MKEEELEKEAKQSYLDNTDHMQWDAEGEFDYTRGYLNAAEPREKRIEELEKQIEKMKCCHNCKNCAYAGFEIICRTYDCINQSKWEIKENDQSNNADGTGLS